MLVNFRWCFSFYFDILKLKFDLPYIQTLNVLYMFAFFAVWFERIEASFSFKTDLTSAGTVFKVCGLKWRMVVLEVAFSSDEQP